MAKDPRRRGPKAMFSLAPVAFRNSPIEGRGVFARRAFRPGEVVVPYAPAQQKVPLDDPAAIAAADTKLTLLSGAWSVIIPDQSVPGGWLCNHSCHPNAELYSEGAGRIQCTRPIAPGEEVTIFYGWVTVNQPLRDPCRCGDLGCRGAINFDLSDDEARVFGDDSSAGTAFRERLAEYEAYLRSIDQDHVLKVIGDRIAQVRRRLGVEG